MPKVNVYLPDQLAAEVRDLGIPLSPICQSALEHEVRKMTAIKQHGNERQGRSRQTPRPAHDRHDQRTTDPMKSHEDGVNMGLAWGFERATEKELEYAEEIKDTDWIHWPLTEDQWPTLYRELVHLGFESYVRSNGDLVLPPDEFIHGFLEGAAGAWWSMADDLA